MKPVFAVECRSRGSSLWFTVAFENTAQEARRELRRIRDKLRASGHSAAYQVGEYRRVKGVWSRTDTSQHRREPPALPCASPELPLVATLGRSERSKALQGKPGHKKAPAG